MLEGLAYSEDGFAMVGNSIADRDFKIYKEIKLSSYPSSSDFLGASTIIRDGDVVVIMRFVGRPDKVGRDPAWFQYDVYEVFIKGCVRQVFRQNLLKV
jgi:hypothetical protein